MLKKSASFLYKKRALNQKEHVLFLILAQRKQEKAKKVPNYFLVSSKISTGLTITMLRFG